MDVEALDPLTPLAALIIGGLAIAGLVLLWALTSALMRALDFLEKRRDRR